MAEQNSSSHTTDEITLLSRRRWDWLGWIGPYLGLILIITVFSVLTWRAGRLETFLSLSNFQIIAVHAMVTAAVAVGMTLIMISGGIDLSVGYVVSLVTVVTVIVYNATQSSVVAIGAGLLTGAAAGALNGAVITKLHVVPFVATLGMMGVARGLGQYLSDGQTIVFDNAPVWVPLFNSFVPEPKWILFTPAVWSVLILAIGTAVLLNLTVLGRHCYAVGSNEAAARLCGIPVERTKITLYVIAGLVTAWAGILETARGGGGTYNTCAGLELEVIAAVVIGGGSLTGGEGTIGGTIIGALILQILENGCSKLQVDNETRFIVIGVIIVAVAALNTWRSRTRA